MQSVGILDLQNWETRSYISGFMVRYKLFYADLWLCMREMLGDELDHVKYTSGRNSRLVVKSKEGSSVTDLIPTLYEMAKAIMAIKCDLDKANAGNKMLEDFSKLESAIMKMTVDIEYMRRKGH